MRNKIGISLIRSPRYPVCYRYEDEEKTLWIYELGTKVGSDGNSESVYLLSYAPCDFAPTSNRDPDMFERV